ncbi:MAG: nicotinate (nicotinamide) nucleotide adenylyltransferase [Clostridia bacterium]|nr:nicotinate (nicotinamide) nucleotide adenylyltransferase [Clostridia bacterium]
MNVAVFGGSFDPVHIEHIRCARAAIESLRLDKLIIMPAHTPPHKPGKILSSDSDRLEMCRLAFADVEKAEVSDYEIARGGTSYTYLTCRHFKEEYPSARLFWLVGTDMLRDFPSWKEPQFILKDATLAVCGRTETDGWIEQEQKAFKEKFGVSFAVVDYNGADVSSTKIRVLAGAGVRLTGITPDSVAEYIHEKGLYRIENAEKALGLEKPKRQEHSLRVAQVAAKRAVQLRLSERKAITAALFHDCAKYLAPDSPYLKGFSLPTQWGDVPKEVAHQFAGAYVAEHTFGVTDEEILDAVRYHTSGRPEMGEIEKLVFLADMIEEERRYEGVEILRELFWKGDSVDECLTEALRQTLEFLKTKKEDIYPLTKQAYEYYAARQNKKCE